MNAERARQLALDAGFDLAGIARADSPPDLAFLAEWIARGHAGEMAYLTEQVAKRSDLRAAFPWARSVLCVGLQYDTPHAYSTEAPAGRGWISRYAWGDDYHDVMQAMLERLLERLRAEAGPFEARAYVDTGPIAEKAYAAAAGLGAFGKNTCLLQPEHGSWFFLGELVTDLDLPADAPRPDMCGSCTACLDACPTQAFPGALRARRDALHQLPHDRAQGRDPGAAARGRGRHVFGCDICQDVCPWNRKRRKRGGAAFEPRPGAAGPGPRRARGPRRGGLPRALPAEPGEARQAARAAAQRGGRDRERGRRAERPLLERARAGRGPARGRARALGARAARRAAQRRCRLFWSLIV